MTKCHDVDAITAIGRCVISLPLPSVSGCDDFPLSGYASDDECDTTPAQLRVDAQEIIQVRGHAFDVSDLQRGLSVPVH